MTPPRRPRRPPPARPDPELETTPPEEAPPTGAADPATAVEEATAEDPAAGLLARVNPSSLTVVRGAKVEPSVLSDDKDTRYQFERTGYFCVDPDSADGKLVFNRTVALRDSWAKVAGKK